MRPDTSDWRNDRCYDFFDTLPIEGLAWECLRRHIPYQKQYASLVDASAEFFYGERFSVSLWGKNIFDKRYIQSVYDNFGYGALVSYQNPREYGVTLKANF